MGELITRDEDLAKAVNEAHANATSALRATMEHMVRAGELLTVAKARVGHGKWLDWLSTTEVSERTARRYIHAFQNQSKLDAPSISKIKSDTVADLDEDEEYEKALRKANRKFESALKTIGDNPWSVGRAMGKMLSPSETASHYRTLIHAIFEVFIRSHETHDRAHDHAKKLFPTFVTLCLSASANVKDLIVASGKRFRLEGSEDQIETLQYLWTRADDDTKSAMLEWIDREDRQDESESRSVA